MPIDQLTDKYKSLIDIVKDPSGKVLAYAMDMSYVDWLNFEIKNFIIRRAVMNQPVSVVIDGELTYLTNPETNVPLLYSDFITDRSGPKFAGYLNEKPGMEYLTANVDPDKRTRLMGLQERSTLRFCRVNVLTLPDKESLNIALAVFAKKHQVQRKLSDFDLTARETSLLESAVLLALKDKLNPKQFEKFEKNPKLAKAIGKTAWQVGGNISTVRINDYLNAETPPELSYEQSVRQSMIFPGTPNFKKYDEPGYDPSTAFTHMLIDGVGRTVRDHYLTFYKSLNETAPVFYRPDSSGVPDTFYGVGIPFFEASVEKINPDGTIKFSTNKDVIEIGDIICDNSSIFGRIFNAKNNFGLMCKKFLSIGITKEQIDTIQLRVAKPGMTQLQVYNATLEELIKALPLETRKKGSELFRKYQLQLDFMESSLIAEEAGKKEGQSQLYKREKNFGKLIGNISDIAPFVIGMLNAAPQSQNARAHLDILKLTTLISVTRWGIDHSNHNEVQNTHLTVSPEQFMDSLNARSYQGEPSSGIRAAFKLNKISKEESVKRLQEYQTGFEPIWQSIQRNKTFFTLINQYKLAKELLNAAPKEDAAESLLNFQEAHSALKMHLEKMIKEEMPALAQKLNDFSANPEEKTEAINNIMDQLEEAIAFGMAREHVLRQRNGNSLASSHQATLPLTDTEEKVPPMTIHLNTKKLTNQPSGQEYFKAVAFPRILIQFLRGQKITGPTVYEALKDIQLQLSDKKALKAATEFMAWKKDQNKNFDVQSINKLIKELQSEEPVIIHKQRGPNP